MALVLAVLMALVMVMMVMKPTRTTNIMRFDGGLTQSDGHYKRHPAETPACLNAEVYLHVHISIYDHM